MGGKKRSALLFKKEVKTDTATTPTIQFTKGQQSAFNEFVRFLESETCRAYILKGYAGTGKTTLVKSFVKELEKRELNFLLLASTGRAAKILSNATGIKASTIHGLIYKFSDLNQNIAEMLDENDECKPDANGQLFLNFDLCPVEVDAQRIYLVDESSMIADECDEMDVQARFGSGRLLNDLLSYDPRGKFVFIGDACQLPPINQVESPALSASYLRREFDMEVMETELVEIVRQGKENDIVDSAQHMRHLYLHPQPWKWAKFPMKGYQNIHVLNSTAELYNAYLKAVKEDGYTEATLLSYSNRQCNEVTEVIRPALGIEGERLCVGDLLLVTQNNYISGLMNGDQVTVTAINGEERRAGMTFLHVEVKEMFSGRVCSQLLLEDVLYSTRIGTSQEQQKALYVDFYVRMKKQGIKQKSDAFNHAMMNDPYLNAIRAAYGYSLTCHKAQGGEWKKVFLDIPRYLAQERKPYVYQWMYTAMTRARCDLYVVKDFYLM